MKLINVGHLSVYKTSNNCLDFNDGDKCILHLDAPVEFNYKVYDLIRTAAIARFNGTIFQKTVTYNDMFCDVFKPASSSTIEVTIYKSDYVSKELISWMQFDSYNMTAEHWWWESHMTLDEYLAPSDDKEIPVVTNFELEYNKDQSALNFNYICDNCKQSYALVASDSGVLEKVRNTFIKCLKKSYEKHKWQCADITFTTPDHTEFYVEFEVQYINNESSLDMDVWVSRKTYGSESVDLLIKVTSLETNGKALADVLTV